MELLDDLGFVDSYPMVSARGRRGTTGSRTVMVSRAAMGNGVAEAGAALGAASGALGVWVCREPAPGGVRRSLPERRHEETCEKLWSVAGCPVEGFQSLFHEP